MNEDGSTSLVPPTPVVPGLVSEETRAGRTLRVVVGVQVCIVILYGLVYGTMSVHAYGIINRWPGLIYIAIAIWCFFLVVLLNGAGAAGLHQHTRWAFVGIHLLPALPCIALACCLLLEWNSAVAGGDTDFFWDMTGLMYGVFFGIPLLLYLILMAISIVLLRRPGVKALFSPRNTKPW